MYRAIYIFILFIVLSSIFTALTACFSRNPVLTPTEDNKLGIHRSIKNAKTKNITTIRPIFTSDMTIKSSVIERMESMIENIRFDTTTNPTVSCSQYSETYAPHFLVQPNYNSRGKWNNTSLPEQLYNFSPLFKNFTDNDVFRIHSSAELKDIKDSLNRSFNQQRGANYNFYALLNHFAFRLIGPDHILKEIGRNNQNLIALSVAYIYTDIVRRFFRYPYEMNDVDDILFNIIIPFRNKVHCIRDGKARHEYCKVCLRETDIFSCCSLELYDSQIKLHGEQHIRNAAQTLHIELRRYLKAKGHNMSSIDKSECFFDDFTVELCRKINYDLLNQESIM